MTKVHYYRYYYIFYLFSIYRGVDIQETDTQGRDLEHYARDSWRMSEQVRNFKIWAIFS